MPPATHRIEGTSKGNRLAAMKSLSSKIDGLASYLAASYRLVRPIPKSPIALPGEDPENLTLVPAKAFRDCVYSNIRRLRQFGVEVGDYAEFGVYNGTSLIAANRAYRAANISGYRLIGFDSFQGLPAEAEAMDGGVWKAGQFRCSRESAVARLATAGVLDQNYHLVEGWYRDTLTPDRRSIFLRPVSIVLIDCDTYDSARLALDFVHPCLSRISVIMLDDWRLNDLDLKYMGERRAYEEFLELHPEFKSQRIRSYNRKSNAFTLWRVR